MPKQRRFVNAGWVAKLCGALAIGCASLYADEYVNFGHFINRPFSEAIAEAGALPIFIDFSSSQMEESFAEFVRGKALDEINQTLQIWAPDFFASDCAAPWKGCNYRFGIFQNSEATHKKTRLIQGINCKMSLEFCDWIVENHGTDLAKMPEFSRLIQRLTKLDQVCHKIFLEKVQEIAQTHPQINQIFYSYKGKQRLPITLRLIRFETSDRFTMPLHFDISVMSLVFPSNDAPLDECLVIAPADGSFTIEKLKRPLRPISENLNQTTALLISGTMLTDLDIPVLPTPHGVLPHNRDFRYVIVACLHIPNLDTSKQSFLLPILHETPQHLRRS